MACCWGNTAVHKINTAETSDIFKPGLPKVGPAGQKWAVIRFDLARQVFLAKTKKLNVF